MGSELARNTAVDPQLRADWTDRYGEEVAATIEQAHLAAEEARRRTVPPNTAATYRRGWTVWKRFCTEHRLPVEHGDQGTLTMFVVWMYTRGKQDGTGYAPTAVDAHLTAAVVGLRERGATVTEEAAAFARDVAKGHAVTLAKAGEIRGRGQAAPAGLDDLQKIARSIPDTLTGYRDLALVLVSFHFAARASEPASLLLADVAAESRGLVVNVRSGKTVRSVRKPAIPYAKDPLVCPVRAWHRWRQALVAECGPAFTDPAGPAFHQISRWGHVGGALGPEAVTRVITRTAENAGVTLRWTGHSLRAGLATEARRAGKDAKAIAAQGGWSEDSRAMHGYMRIADQWTDNASAGLS